MSAIASVFSALSMNPLQQGLSLLAQSQPIQISLITQRNTHHPTSPLLTPIPQIHRRSSHKPPTTSPHSTTYIHAFQHSPHHPSKRFRNLPTLRQPRNRILKFPPTNRHHRIPHLTLRHDNTKLVFRCS